MWCKDCRRTSALLDRLGVDHVHVDLEAEPDRVDEARELAGRTDRGTVPRTRRHPAHPGRPLH
ncbi:MAG: glutaredoxin [Ilumatobacteraceae bacterium]